ncbi:hypothetical protein [Absidia glauca]|uniref:EamA domain-containing protein n=1 Tax=Absidia glauca TaxID=4829 RepID=A0A168RAP0_ABSGL|nr:hypothetical protein [Absidia glauca]
MTDLTRRRYFGGIAALLGVVFIWVTSSFAMNVNVVLLSPILFTDTHTVDRISFGIEYLWGPSLQQTLLDHLPEHSNILLLLNTLRLQEKSGQEQDSTTTKLSTYETIKLSLAFCILWFFANYTTNASLAYTSVGSSTILASMSGNKLDYAPLDTKNLIGGIVDRIIYPWYWRHVQCRKDYNGETSLCLHQVVIFSFVGVILVSYSDQRSHLPHPPTPPLENIDTTDSNSRLSAALVGDILALLGAVFYGCYTTMLKVRIGDEDRIDMPLFFGFVGAFNVLLLWPLFPLLDWLGIETFQLPFNSTLWVMVLLNAFIGTFLSDYLWLLAMLMTSPLVVTLGISLTIPLALFGDVVFKHFVPQCQYALGALLVVIGFFSVNMSALNERNDKENDGDDDQQQPLIPNNPSISTNTHYQAI